MFRFHHSSRTLIWRIFKQQPTNFFFMYVMIIFIHELILAFHLNLHVWIVLPYINQVHILHYNPTTFVDFGGRVVMIHLEPTWQAHFILHTEFKQCHLVSIVSKSQVWLWQPWKFYCTFMLNILQLKYICLDKRRIFANVKPKCNMASNPIFYVSAFVIILLADVFVFYSTVLFHRFYWSNCKFYSPHPAFYSSF